MRMISSNLEPWKLKVSRARLSRSIKRECTGENNWAHTPGLFGYFKPTSIQFLSGSNTEEGAQSFNILNTI
jgi:hypothetical protein